MASPDVQRSRRAWRLGAGGAGGRLAALPGLGARQRAEPGRPRARRARHPRVRPGARAARALPRGARPRLARRAARPGDHSAMPRPGLLLSSTARPARCTAPPPASFTPLRLQSISLPIYICLCALGRRAVPRRRHARRARQVWYDFARWHSAEGGSGPAAAAAVLARGRLVGARALCWVHCLRAFWFRCPAYAHVWRRLQRAAPGQLRPERPGHGAHCVSSARVALGGHGTPAQERRPQAICKGPHT